MWISEFFGLTQYLESKDLTYNFFGEYSTLLTVGGDYDDREFIKYRLVETETTIYSSFISQSYDFISRLTGDVRVFTSIRPI